MNNNKEYRIKGNGHIQNAYSYIGYILRYMEKARVKRIPIDLMPTIRVGMLMLEKHGLFRSEKYKAYLQIKTHKHKAIVYFHKLPTEHRKMHIVGRIIINYTDRKTYLQIEQIYL